MKTTIIIPARYASTRLPGKLLLDHTGKPLLQHTWEKALQVEGIDNVIIATDDQRIIDAVNKFGGNAVMTDKSHTTGSARIAEAACQIDSDIIVNIQGDEPEIDPTIVAKLVKLQIRANTFCSTVACPFNNEPLTGPGSPEDHAAVKIVTKGPDDAGITHAVYFSRQKIPYTNQNNSAFPYLMHIGIYVFSRDSLRRFAAHSPTPLEQAENLEQLRILEMGERIAVLSAQCSSPGIDTPEDYAAFVKRINR